MTKPRTPEEIAESAIERWEARNGMLRDPHRDEMLYTDPVGVVATH